MMSPGLPGLCNKTSPQANDRIWISKCLYATKNIWYSLHSLNLNFTKKYEQSVFIKELPHKTLGLI